MLVCLQVGHKNIKSNIDVDLRGATGAPGELELNTRISDAVSQKLTDRGFQVKLVDANFNSNDERVQDYDLFLAVHGDADYGGSEGGGFVDYPDPSVDVVTARSKNIKEAIESEYFNHSGIRNVPSRSNPNTKYYYMWQYLSENTPCCLIELGEVQDPHDKVILADTERVANALTRGICKAFSIQFDITPPTDPCSAVKSLLSEAQAEIEGFKKQVESEKKFDEDLARTLGVANQQSDILGAIAKFVGIEDNLRNRMKDLVDIRAVVKSQEDEIIKLNETNKSLSTLNSEMYDYYEEVERQFGKLKIDYEILKTERKELSKYTGMELVQELIDRLFHRN